MSETAEHLRLVESLQAAEPVADPLVGTTIDNRYQIVGRLGEGGMGVVYHARHVVLQKDLAVKVLRADVSKDQEIIARFRQEAQSASAIGSQHIIDISDFGQLVDGSTYFIMEYLGGQELTKLIEGDDAIPTERTVRIAKQLCDALGAAHDAGIVHRDMKPDNVFLIRRGGTDDFVKVLDFGIAKVGGASSKLTKAGQVFGTPHYMSPEQCSGQGVDHRTDIYAVGVILYEMACGRVPFDADNLMGILTKHIYEQPIPPHTLPPPISVPPGLEAVILKCLAKSAETRYQTMAEVKADLEALEAGQTPRAVVDRLDGTGAHSIAGLPPGSTANHAALSVQVGGADAGEGGGSKIGLIIGAAVGALALLGAAVAVLFLVIYTPDEPPPPPEIVEPPPEIVEPPPEIVEPPPELADNEETEEPPVDEPPPVVQVTIGSEPAGAEVWLGADDQASLLGNTPFAIDRPTGSERLRLTLKHPGFEDTAVVVSRLTQDVTLTLRPVARSRGRRNRSQTGGSTTTQPATDTPTTQPEATPPAGRGRRGGTDGVIDPWG